MSRVFYLLFVLCLGLVLGSCNRSRNYAEDQEFFKAEPSSYYNRGGPGGQRTKRIENLGQPKKRMVVLDFWNDTPIQLHELGRYTANEIRRELHNTRRVLIPADARTKLGTAYFIEGRGC